MQDTLDWWRNCWKIDKSKCMERKEKQKAYLKKYRQRNKDKIKKQQQEYRQRKKLKII